MIKHCFEEVNKPIQELIQIMRDDYPNGFELVITPIGAEIRSTLTTLVFSSVDDNIANDLQKQVNNFFEAIRKAGETQGTAQEDDNR
jgi:hypothetical protein